MALQRNLKSRLNTHFGRSPERGMKIHHKQNLHEEFRKRNVFMPGCWSSNSTVNMSKEIPVTAKAFEAIQNIDTDKLSALSERELRPILSCLVRMSLCSPLDTSDKWGERRKEILRCLAGIETVNSLVGLLSIDFHALEQDAKKEQQLRSEITLF